MNSQKTVLIVEDEKNIVDILRFNLQREGYQTCESYDGEDGLSKALSVNPDLILLDVMLPDMDGFEVCRRIRAGNNRIGIIMLTARVEDIDKIMGLTIGADDYITKPFNPLELVARVKTQLRRYTRYNRPEGEAVPAQENEHDIRGLVINKSILLSGFTENIRSLIIGTNLGGLGTLIASMASLISYREIARELPLQKGRYFALFTGSNTLFVTVLMGAWALAGYL